MASRRRAHTQPDGCIQENTKAGGYTRVSTEEQARHGVSLDAQEERIRAYCTMAGLEMGRLISEQGVSASKALRNRPGGAELIAAVDRGEVQHVVALKLDRLFRDAEDALHQTKAWDRAGVALHLVDMGGQTLNTASAMGRFFLNMMAAFAELERNLIAERTSTALSHKKRQRSVYGPTPYAFSAIAGKLEANSAESTTLAMMRTWRAEGWSYREIAAELQALGIPRKRGGQKWHASTVQRILQNDIHLPAAA